jgi:outer membrane protein assembly factor BamA
MAESQGVIDKQLEGIPEISDESQFGFRNGSIVVAPIPFSNPTIGSGLMLGAGYLFTTGPGSNPSSIGVGALRSDNGSQGVGLSVNLAFDSNLWLFKSMFAKADARYDLFTPVGVLPIRQDGVLARMSLAYGVTPQLSFGAALRYLDTKITPDTPGLPPIPPPFNQFLDVEIASIGLVSDWDRRDDTIYATQGGLLHVEAFHNVALSGLVQDYEKGYLTYTHYFKLGQSGVFVASAAACAASEDTPFFDLCGLGTTDAFRGFSATQFISQRSASLQVEYRHQFTKRLGMVGFGGIGQVGKSIQDLDVGGTHSAIGLGARYRVSKKFPLDFSIDASHNYLGENLLYIYVGQRF